MAIERRAGAPRLIDWTGERCVPWAPDVQVVYEHYHRYLWAAELVRGRRVLDMGSGEGFGSAILAGTAEHVTAIDLDPATIEHSQLNYVAPKLAFEVGSALDLDRFESGSFGAVVTFELIEHVSDHERVLAGIERVLAPDGLLLISTPDRRMYTDATGRHNPFHERELTEPELRALLGARFGHLALFGQRAVAGSRIAAVERPTLPTGRPFALRKVGEDWHSAGEPAPMYLVAVASNEPLPALPTDSLLSDYELEILRQHAERTAAAGRELSAAQGEVERVEHELADARRAAAQQQQEQRERQDVQQWEQEAQQQTLEVSFDRIAAQRDEIEQLKAERAHDATELRRMRESIVWNTFQRVRGKLFSALGGTGSRRARTLQWSIRKAGRALGSGGGPDARRPAYDEIRFPEFEQPLVSLIVTAYTGADVTAACLRSIAERTEGPAYEVVVVDDAADAENARLWEAVHGARILVNDPGIGYLRSVNRGAAAARGTYLVLMNNDVEVSTGWLRALVMRAETDARRRRRRGEADLPKRRPPGGGGDRLPRRQRRELRQARRPRLP